MVKGLSKYSMNIMFYIGMLSILSLLILTNTGSKSDIFCFAIILSPMLIILIPKNSLKIDFAFAVLLTLVIALYAWGYWEYRDRPMSYLDYVERAKKLNLENIYPSKEELMGGWFSFENELRLDLMFIWSLASMALSFVIRTIFNKSRVKRSPIQNHFTPHTQ